MKQGRRVFLSGGGKSWKDPEKVGLYVALSMVYVVGLLLFLAWRQLTIVVEENHRREEALTPYSYFHILKWP